MIMMSQEQLHDAFYTQYVEDTNRDDIGTSKCMHCLFRHNCRSVPRGCPFVDDRTPMNRLSFEMSDIRGNTSDIKYDCGWLLPDEGDPVAKMPDELPDLVGITASTRMTRTRPFDSGVGAYHILPMRGELYNAFLDRVDKLVTQVTESLHGVTSVEDRMRTIIKGMGLSNDLKEKYCDNLHFLMDDIWPGMTMSEVVNMYDNKGGLSIRECLSEIKKITRKEQQEGRDEPR